MRNVTTMLCLAAAVLSAGVLAAAEDKGLVAKVPPAGTFKMREDLKGKHPRLYFSREDVPRIKALARGEGKFFVEQMRRAYAGPYTGKDIPAQLTGGESWKRYLYGFWGLFSFDMLYLVEGDVRYRDTAKKWALQLARNDWWIRDDIAPMDSLAGLSLTYDTLYDEFTEAERKEIRRSIHKRLDFIYQRFFVGQYWTQDGQNNHMHNRLHGLMHGAFAIYGDDPEFDTQKHADLAVSMVGTILQWLPEDGSQHEGPGYWSFGHHWIARAVQLAGRMTGENLAELNPHMTSAQWFRIYMTAPGWKATMNIGDAGAGALGNPTPLLLPIKEARDGHGMDAVAQVMKVSPNEFYQHPAWGLLWYDPTIKVHPLAEMPLWRFWPDLEMFSIRSSWNDDATAFVFKCGPVGGHRLQKMRGGNWANVAHDHPDQNHFLLFAHGKMLAEDDGYPHQKKLTRSHNTITIDGNGQPREGTGWQQPFPYDQTGYLDDVFLSHDTAYAAGNGSRLYAGAEKFVRHVAFVGGQYVIAVDDLVGAGAGEHEYEWRLHKDGEWQTNGPGGFVVYEKDAGTAGGAAATAGAEIALNIAFLAPAPDAMEDAFLPAELTAKPCLAVAQRGRTAKFVTLIVPQRNGAPELKGELDDAADRLLVTVTGQASRTDLFAVAKGKDAFAFGRGRAAGAAALMIRGGKGVVFALLTRGTLLSHGDTPLIRAAQPTNVSWRRVGGIVLVETEAPYKTEGGPVTLKIGGLEPGKDLTFLVNGMAKGTVKSDAQGVVSIDADLSARTVFQIGGTESIVFSFPGAATP